MTFVTVDVTKPGNRLIYINGNYVEAAGNSSLNTFTLPAGDHILEALTGANAVDYRKRIRIRRGDEEVSVELDPVDPPEPVDL